MTGGWSLRRSEIEVPCILDVAHTADSLHAHVELESDLEIRAGDSVQLLNPPEEIAFGERRLIRGRARIRRAGWLRRLWTRLAARVELTELYEVSFSTRRRL